MYVWRSRILSSFISHSKGEVWGWGWLSYIIDQHFILGSQLLLHRCTKHYLNALLSDGMRDEAMEFVQTCGSELKVATLWSRWQMWQMNFLLHVICYPSGECRLLDRGSTVLPFTWSLWRCLLPLSHGLCCPELSTTTSSGIGNSGLNETAWQDMGVHKHSKWSS